jgi:hypothetical protein
MDIYLALANYKTSNEEIENIVERLSYMKKYQIKEKSPE